MMMRKKYKWVVPMIMVGLLFGGCAKSSEPADTVENNIEQSTTKNKKKKVRPDLYGKVKKIVGNEVTLELAELPQRKEMSEEERKKMKEKMQNSNPGEGGFGGQGNKMKREIKFTGETKNMIIPVGLPLISSKGGEENQLELEDIVEGTFLQIWLNEDESVKSVRVMQGRQ